MRSVHLSFHTDRRSLAAAAVKAVLACIALVLDISLISEAAIKQAIKNDSLSFINQIVLSKYKLGQFLADIFLSLQYDTLIISLVFLGLLIYFLAVRHHDVSGWRKFTIIAFFLSLLMMVCCFQQVEILEKMAHSGRTCLKFLLCLVGYTILLDRFFRDVWILFDQGYFFESKVSPQSRLGRLSAAHSKTRFMVTVTSIFLVSWGIYVISHYPGLMIDDCAHQFREMSGLPHMLDDFLIRGTRPESYYTNANPIATTMLLKIFFDLGNLIHNQNAGIFLYICLQTLFMAVVMAYLGYFMQARGAKRGVIIFYVIFTALFPFYPQFASYVLPKNGIFAAFFVLYSIILYRMIFEKECLESRKFIVRAIAVTAVMCLLNKTGIYLAGLTAAVLLLTNIREVKTLKFRRMAFILILSLVIPIGVDKTADAKMNLIHVKPVEAYSLFFQQTGRYVIDHGDDVTAHERAVLDRIFDYDSIPKYFTYYTADGMKDGAFRYDTATREDLADYWSVWLHQFIRHPGSYFTAAFELQRNLFNITYAAPLMYNYDFSQARMDRNFNSSRLVYYGRFYITPAKMIHYHMGKRTKEFAHLTENMNRCASKLPVIGLFCNMGIYAYIYLLLIFFGFFRRDWKFLQYMTVIFVFYLILAASPYAGFRYLFPVMCTWILYAFAFGREKQK